VWRRVHTDGSYESANDVRAHSGLGEKSQIRAVLVHWPDGSKESWDNIQPDSIVTLRQGSGKPLWNLEQLVALTVRRRTPLQLPRAGLPNPRLVLPLGADLRVGSQTLS
jgi:hypothetical protein